ncbi:sugar ABC transporter substrate-binding protein [Clostridium cellulovorans]|uniref:Extracellular solute-binding protein family 1 n=1 Tax=Clostridium cellulovorans (strain ATCC 35296 / DSM 3052 / OCM 3 / 743B) TaxID=573061 RepID=D9SRI9_CLOC7|nr:sugar ABC transporter substrate-binding protein [Clostridium cellulovorans]ADL52418.1 extracellular solute-binding protein family 1 [Clostridium cellulovorans 743B]
MKKRLLTTLMASVLTLSLIGCGSKTNETTKTDGSNADKEVNLNVWIMPNSGTPDQDFMEVIQPFLDKNPNIKVTPTVLDWGSAWTKITAAATSGEAPDITQLGTSWVAAVGAMNALEDLTPYYNDFGGDDAFVKATLDTTKIEGQKEKYAMPWFIDTRAIFYRKDACQKAGVDPTKDFATWDSYKAALKKLNGVEVDGKKMSALGMPGKNDWNVVHNFAWWVWGAGGQYIQDGKAVINSKEAYEGVKFYTELASDGLMPKAALEKNSAEVEALFNQGEYATIFSGAYLAKTIKTEFEKDSTKALDPSKVGIAMVPEGPKGRFALFGGSTLAMYKSSKNKPEAAKLLAYLATADSQVAYAKKHGNLPANAKSFDDKFITDDPLLSVFKQQLQYGKAYPSVPGWAPSEGLFQKGLSNVWDNVMGVNGAYDPAKTQTELDATVNDVNAVLKQ